MRIYAQPMRNAVSQYLSRIHGGTISFHTFCLHLRRHSSESLKRQLLLSITDKRVFWGNILMAFWSNCNIFIGSASEVKLLKILWENMAQGCIWMTLMQTMEVIMLPSTICYSMKHDNVGTWVCLSDNWVTSASLWGPLEWCYLSVQCWDHAKRWGNSCASERLKMKHLFCIWQCSLVNRTQRRAWVFANTTPQLEKLCLLESD